MAKMKTWYVTVGVFNDEGESHQIGVRVHDATELLSTGSIWGGGAEYGYTVASSLRPELGMAYEREIHVSILDDDPCLLRLEEGSRFMAIPASDFCKPRGFARFIGAERKPEPAPVEA